MAGRGGHLQIFLNGLEGKQGLCLLIRKDPRDFTLPLPPARLLTFSYCQLQWDFPSNSTPKSIHLFGSSEPRAVMMFNQRQL